MDIEEMHGAEAVQNNEISDEDLGDIAGGNVFKKAKKALKKAKKSKKKPAGEEPPRIGTAAECLEYQVGFIASK